MSPHPSRPASLLLPRPGSSLLPFPAGAPASPAESPAEPGSATDGLRPQPLRLRSALKFNSVSSHSSPLPGAGTPRLASSSETSGSPLATPSFIAKLPQLPGSPSPALSPRLVSPRARSSSEVLPPGYERRVGFITVDAEEPSNKGCANGAEYSFTLQAKSSDYRPRKDSRCFLVATDGEHYSIEALDWLVTSLVEHGDEVVVLQVIPASNSGHKAWLVENEERSRNEAQDVLRHVLNKNDRQITVTVEFVVGHVIKTVQRMIELYQPDSLVVGTRGKVQSAWQKAFSLGSTSQYLVARSPVPVIVVRPESKVRESKEARAKDPKRQLYQALIGSSVAKHP